MYGSLASGGGDPPVDGYPSPGAAVPAAHARGCYYKRGVVAVTDAPSERAASTARPTRP
jgi:hypothetical protein